MWKTVVRNVEVSHAYDMSRDCFGLSRMQLTIQGDVGVSSNIYKMRFQLIEAVITSRAQYFVSANTYRSITTCSCRYCTTDESALGSEGKMGTSSQGVVGGERILIWI